MLSLPTRLRVNDFTDSAGPAVRRSHSTVRARAFDATTVP